MYVGTSAPTGQRVLAGSPDKRLRRGARRREAYETFPAALYAVLDPYNAYFSARLFASVLHDASYLLGRRRGRSAVFRPASSALHT